MFACPECNESIEQADIENGFCPHCGSAFPAGEESEEPEDEKENS